MIINKEQRIQENIQYITEILSVSDDAIAIVDEITNTILNDCWRYNKSVDVETGLDKLSGHETYELMGYTFDIDVTIFNYKDVPSFYNKQPNLINEFDAEKQKLILTLVMISGELYTNLSDAAITHEVIHMYQWCKNKVNNPNFKKLTNDGYQHCLKVIKGNFPDDKRKLAYIIYYSNFREQDAFVNEYYKESKISRADFDDKTTIVERRIYTFEGLIDWYKEVMYSPHMQSYLQDYRQFGYTPENILKYAEWGLKRFKAKYGKVKARLLGEFNSRAPFGENILKDLADYFDRLIEEKKKKQK